MYMVAPEESSARKGSAESADRKAEKQGDTLPALELGHFCVIWNKSGPKSVLAVMEVLGISEDDQSFLGWWFLGNRFTCS